MSFHFQALQKPAFLPSDLSYKIKLARQSRVKQKELGFELQGSASYLGSEGSLSEFLTDLRLAQVDLPLIPRPPGDSHHCLGQPVASSPQESSIEPLGLSVQQPFLYFICSDQGKKKQPTNNSLTARRHRHADIMLDEVSERGIIYSTGLISECQTAIRTKIMLLGNCVYLCHGEPL